MTPTLYGIPNCDTVRKARRWLDAAGVDYRFHDFKKLGLEGALLDSWLATLGHETLLNRRGTTWRQLPAATKDNLDPGNVRNLILDNLSIIKRPVLDMGSQTHVGFSTEDYERLFSS
jgi:arsenate reductase (glutaredoxin)